MPDFDAVVLAGGRGSRLGGVSKADLEVGGRRLLDRVLGAVRGARTVVVVGDVAVPRGVRVTSEQPPGTGPAAGLVAGLAAVDAPAEWTLVLACDLPGAQDAVALLLAAADAAGDATADSPADGYCLAAPDGTPQWLLGIHRSGALRRVAEAYGDPRNRSLRGLLAGLRLAAVADSGGAGRDLDTPADHAHWNEHWARVEREGRASWEDYVDRACAAVGIERSLVDIDGILGMTREVAHAGARPMAPVSAFLLGLAVGREPGADIDYLIRVVEDAATAAPIPPKKEKP